GAVGALGAVDRAHPARAEPLGEAPGADHPSGPVVASVGGIGGGPVEQRAVEPAAALGGGVGGQEGGDRVAEGGVVAGGGEPRGAGGGGLVEGVEEEGFDAGVPGRIGHAAAHGGAVMARWSQARAAVHSRLTVAGERPSTSAASSMVSPTK